LNNCRGGGHLASGVGTQRHTFEPERRNRSFLADMAPVQESVKTLASPLPLTLTTKDTSLAPSRSIAPLPRSSDQGE
jgi:hypothetical protein